MFYPPFTIDLKIKEPSSDPSIESEALSGWGIIPKIFLFLLNIPAISIHEPFGFPPPLEAYVNSI